MGFVLIRVFFWHSFGAISALLKECLAPFLHFDSRSEIGLISHHGNSVATTSRQSGEHCDNAASIRMVFVSVNQRSLTYGGVKALASQLVSISQGEQKSEERARAGY